METNDRILVIDDDKAILETYQGILTPEDTDTVLTTGANLFDDVVSELNVEMKRYDLQLCSSPEKGIEAVEAAKAAGRPFAVAFIDMKMPGMDGAQTSKKIWEIDPDVKIVIVTAYSEFGVDDIIQTVGRHDILFLRKPFYQEEIQQFAKTLTHIRHLEQINKQHRQILEQTVEEKTCDLKRTNERLVKLDKEKSAFIGYLSHEINTPLNWISATDIMDKDELSENNREMVKLVEKGLERISGLMDEMISYFQISDLDTKINPVPMSLNESVALALNKSDMDIQRKQIDVEVDIPNSESVKADPLLFDSIVFIIINNAIRFSEPKGRVRINAVSENSTVLFTVRDQGCGIDPEGIDLIFDPFSNLEAGRHGNQGYGLSLPKAKLIADIHGWDIRAWSIGPGKETGFTVLMKK